MSISKVESTSRSHGASSRRISRVSPWDVGCGDLYASEHVREQCYNEPSRWESTENREERKISVEWKALVSHVLGELGRWLGLANDKKGPISTLRFAAKDEDVATAGG